jgi:hypothetical protein
MSTQIENKNSEIEDLIKWAKTIGGLNLVDHYAEELGNRVQSILTHQKKMIREEIKNNIDENKEGEVFVYLTTLLSLPSLNIKEDE